MTDSFEYILLCEYQVQRLETFNKYKEFIENLDKGKKQIRFRTN